MATLNLEINPNQAVNAAKTFMKVVEDIQRFIQNVDAASFTKMPAQIQAVIDKIRLLENAIGRLQAPLNTFNSIVMGIVNADPGGKLATSFGKLLGMLREVRESASGLGTILKNAATQVDNINSASSSRSQGNTSGSSNIGDSVSGANDVAQMTRALVTLNSNLSIVQNTSTAASAALVTFSASSLGATIAVRGLNRELETLLLSMGRAQVASQGPSSRNLLGPGQQKAVQPFVFEATGGYDSSAERFKTSMRGVGDVIDSTAVTKDRFRKNVRDLKSDMDNADPSNTQLFRGLIALQIVFGQFTFGRIISSIRQFTDELYETGERLQILRQTFLAAAGGDIQEAAHNFEVASRLAREFGIDLLTTANNTARLQAAARGSNVEGERANIIARGASAAVAVLGANSEKASNVIKVFTDVLSKGRVQSEELVKQFGNAVPGAFRLAAEGIGISVTELTEAMQRGTLVAGDTAVQIAQALLKVYETLAKANADTLKGSFANLGSAYTRFKEQILVGGAEAGLIIFFKTLTETLENPKLLEAARSIGELLGKVLVVAVNAVTFAITIFAANWQILTALIVGFVATGALISLAVSLGLVVIGLGAFTTAAVGAAGASALFLSVLGPVSLIIGFVAVLSAAALALINFGVDSNKVSEDLKKAQEEAQKAFEFKSKLNTNPADITRAFNDALQNVEKEIRTFNQDVQNQAQLLDVLSSGVSSLSSEYDAYVKVLERVRSLERSNKFESLDAANAEAVKKQVTDIFLQMERVNSILVESIKLQKDLDQLQERTSVAQTTFTTVAQTADAGNVSSASFRLQEEYDNIVIPALKRTQEQLSKTTDPDQVRVITAGFDNFSKSVQQSVFGLRQAQDAMRALVGITEDFRELTLEQGTTRLLSDIQYSRDFIRGQVGSAEENKRAVEEFSKSQQIIIPPRIRSLGDELQQGFDPSNTGRMMGESFVEIFTKSLGDLEARFKGLFPQMNQSGSSGGSAGSSRNIPTDGSTGYGNYRELISRASAQRGVDQELIRRIIANESAFDPNAVGHNPDGSVARNGGRGLMQLVNSTARSVGVTNSFDPEQNVMGGTLYVRQLLDKNNGDLMRTMTNYRGVGPDKDPAYFQRILGGYQGTGYAPVPAGDFGGGSSRGSGAGASFDSDGVTSTDSAIQQISVTIEKESEVIDKTTEAINNHIRSYISATSSITEFNAAATDIIGKLESSTVGLAQSALTEAQARDAGNASLERYVKLAGTAETQSGKEASRLIGIATFYDRAKREGDAYNLSLQGQIVSLQAQSNVMDENSTLREANIDSIQRYYQAVNSGAAFDERSLDVFRRRTEELRREQIRSNAVSQGFEVRSQSRDTRFEIESLKDDTIERAANLEARKAIFDLETSGLSVSDRVYQNLTRDIEARRRLRIEFERANGPVQRYIDSIGDFSQRMQEVGINALDRFGDALATFATTGEFDFKSFVNSIITDLLRLYFQIAVIRPLLEGLSSGSSDGSGGGIGGTILSVAGAFARAYAGGSGGELGAVGSGTAPDTGSTVTFGSGGDPAYNFATGGWIGRGGTIHRFENGGLVGNDSIPAMLSPGETVRTSSQEAALRKGMGGGDNYNFSVVINATDGDSVKQTAPQVFSQIYKQLQRNAKRNGLER